MYSPFLKAGAEYLNLVRISLIWCKTPCVGAGLELSQVINVTKFNSGPCNKSVNKKIEKMIGWLMDYSDDVSYQ
jgi:hypothetical protein